MLGASRSILRNSNFLTLKIVGKRGWLWAKRGYQRMVGRVTWSKRGLNLRACNLKLCWWFLEERMKPQELLRTSGFLLGRSPLSRASAGCRREMEVSWLAQWLPGFNLKSLGCSQECVTGPVQSFIDLPIHFMTSHSPIPFGRPWPVSCEVL